MTDAWGAEGGIAQYNRDFLNALASSSVVEHVDVLAYTAARDFAAVPHPKIRARAIRSRSAFATHCIAAARKRELVFCGHVHLAPVAAWAAKRARAPLWLQVHGIEAWPHPANARRRASEYASLVTAVSRYTRERVCAWSRIDQHRVRVLPNTVDVRAFNFAPRESRGAPVILTVGRISASERYKGHDRVIAQLPRLRERHPGLRYRIIGDGDDRDRLVQVAATNGVADAVDFAGHLPRELLPREMRSATVFAMPSTGEGFGIAFLEALACGTPAIGLDSDGSRDALGDGELGIVCTEESLFSSLDAALTQSTDAKALSTRALERYSPDKFRAQVDALAKELIGQ